MNQSNVIFLCGLYVILGVYSYSIHKVDVSEQITAINTVSLVQAEQIARSGISIALNTVNVNHSTSFTSTQNLFGGQVKYTVIPSKITSASDYNGCSVTMVANIVYYKGRYVISSIRTV